MLTFYYVLIEMFTVGYEQPDGTVKYLYTNDDSLENIINDYIYSDKSFESIKPDKYVQFLEVDSIEHYLDSELSDEEDTRYRLLKKQGGKWMIRDNYMDIPRNIEFTTVLSGGKRSDHKRSDHKRSDHKRSDSKRRDSKQTRKNRKTHR